MVHEILRTHSEWRSAGLRLGAIAISDRQVRNDLLLINANYLREGIVVRLMMNTLTIHIYIPYLRSLNYHAVIWKARSVITILCSLPAPLSLPLFRKHLPYFIYTAYLSLSLSQSL